MKDKERKKTFQSLFYQLGRNWLTRNIKTMVCINFRKIDEFFYYYYYRSEVKSEEVS